jgi:hypothetical protein
MTHVIQETLMTANKARQRAEKAFKQEERERDGKAAMAQYEAGAVAVREKTARLKALRLAKQAQADSAVPNRTRRTQAAWGREIRAR